MLELRSLSASGTGPGCCCVCRLPPPNGPPQQGSATNTAPAPASAPSVLASSFNPTLRTAIPATRWIITSRRLLWGTELAAGTPPRREDWRTGPSAPLNRGGRGSPPLLPRLVGFLRLGELAIRGGVVDDETGDAEGQGQLDEALRVLQRALLSRELEV